MRSYLRDSAVESYATVPGLLQKIWVSSTGPEGEIWGGVYLWETWKDAYGRPPGISQAAELIGYRPTQRLYFSVEAATEGGAARALTAGLGLAFESGDPEPLTRPAEFVPPDASDFIPHGGPHGG